MSHIWIGLVPLFCERQYPFVMIRRKGAKVYPRGYKLHDEEHQETH